MTPILKTPELYWLRKRASDIEINRWIAAIYEQGKKDGMEQLVGAGDSDLIVWHENDLEAELQRVGGITPNACKTVIKLLTGKMD